jgi:hypothetical protein
VQVSGLAGAVAASGGFAHSLALKSDGTVWAWGANGDGQLGNGSTTNSSTPVQVSGLPGAVSAIAAGYNHGLAIVSGNVWAWGNNGDGQLGNGTTTNSSSAVQTTGLTNIIAVSGGWDHSLALKSDGTVWAWGNNAAGQLGNGTNTASSVPALVIGLPMPAVAIAAGGFHSLALLSNGTVWAWGSNSNGQLGNGTTISSVVPVQVSGLTGMSLIAAGEYHSLALKSDGTVWAWGDNAAGQLGNGLTADSSVPVQAALTTATSIAAGGLHSLAADSVPAAPVLLSAAAGVGQVALSWTASAFATGYNVKRATASGGPFSTIASPSGHTYTDAGLTDGTTYCYEITALGSCGEGLPSNVICATAKYPTPAISSISPTSAWACYPTFTLTVNGSNFFNGATVKWNGTALATTFTSSIKLTATVPAGTAPVGTVSITVDNPAPEVAGSNSKPLVIGANPLPVIASLSPGSPTANTAFTLTVSGSGFTPCSTITWNGSAIPTTYHSATWLSSAIPASLNNAVASIPIQVVTPGPGGGTSNTKTLNVIAPALMSLTISPGSVTGNISATGKVTLNAPAVSGQSVALTSSNASAASPAINPVPVTAGSTTATFAISTFPVAANTPVTITGTLGATKSANMTVLAPVVSTIALSPNSVYGGLNSNGTLTLNGPVPSGGMTFPLSSNNFAVANPGPSVTITSGSSGPFTVTTTPVSANTTVAISSGTKMTNLMVKQPALFSLSVSPTSVHGGTSTTLTITLTSPAPSPGGTNVTLSSNMTAVAQVSSPAPVGATLTTTTVTVTTSHVTMNKTVTITGSAGGVTKTVMLTVTP